MIVSELAGRRIFSVELLDAENCGDDEGFFFRFNSLELKTRLPAEKREGSRFDNNVI